MENNERHEYMAYMRDNKMQNAYTFDEEKAHRMAENKKKYKGLKKAKNMIFAVDVFFVMVVFAEMILGMQQVAFGSIIIGKNLVEIAALSLITFTKLTDEDIFKKAIAVSAVLWVLYKFILPFNGFVMTAPYFLYIIQSLLCIWLGREENKLSGEEGYPYFQDVNIGNSWGRTKSYIPDHFSNEVRGRKMETVGMPDEKAHVFNGANNGKMEALGVPEKREYAFAERNRGFNAEMGGLDTSAAYLNNIQPNDLNGKGTLSRNYNSGEMDGVSAGRMGVNLEKHVSMRNENIGMDEAGIDLR